MASVSLLAPKILKWESELFVNDPIDKGGATKDGITLSTWLQVGYDKNLDGKIDVEDIKLIDRADFEMVLKRDYWDRWMADKIPNQSIADILVDWVWGSGAWGIIIPQRILDVKPDGVVGKNTIMALNSKLPSEIFQKIFDARINFINNCVNKSIFIWERDNKRKSTPEEQMKFTQKRFQAGWFNRLQDFKFIAQ